MLQKALLILFICLPTFAAEKPTRENGVILVGSELDFFPYAHVNEKGEADGFSVDLIKAVAHVMSLKIKIIPEPWDKIWNDLVEGRIDVLPLVGKMPERALVIDFSMPHTGTSDAFFSRKGETPYKSLAEAKGKSIVVMRSDVAHHKLTEHKFDGEIITVPTISEGLKLVASGKHDMFLGPLLMGTLALKEHGIPMTAGPPVPEYIRIQAFGVKKGDVELLAKLNQGLEIIKSNGEYNRIYNRWLAIETVEENGPNYGAIAFVIVTIVVLILLVGLVRKKNRQA